MTRLSLQVATRRESHDVMNDDAYKAIIDVNDNDKVFKKSC